MKRRPKLPKLPDDEDSARKLVLENLPKLENYSERATTRAFILSLLERFPRLAAETYFVPNELSLFNPAPYSQHEMQRSHQRQTKKLMLYIFLDNQASLSKLKKVYELYPNALTEAGTIDASQSDGEAPEHPILDSFSRATSDSACSLSFLVQKCPQLSQQRDKRGRQPIHRLLSRIVVLSPRSHHHFLPLLGLLMDSNPGWCNGELFGTLSLQFMQLRDEIFDFIFEKAKAQGADSFCFRLQSHSGQYSEDLKKISKAMPVLKELSCISLKRCDSSKAFTSIVNSILDSGENLRTLLLSVPSSTGGRKGKGRKGKEVDNAFRQLLGSSSGINKITLRRSGDDKFLDGTSLKAMCEALATRETPLDCLTLEGFDFESDSSLPLFFCHKNSTKRLIFSNVRFTSTDMLSGISPPLLNEACLEELEMTFWASESFSTKNLIANIVLHIPKLKCLKLDAFHFGVRNDVTESILQVLQRGKLQELYLGANTAVNLLSLAEALKNTNCLRSLRLAPVVPTGLNELLGHLNRFSNNIETSNTTLEECKFEFFVEKGNEGERLLRILNYYELNVLDDQMPQLVKKIQFYCKLNRYGRKIVRDPTATKTTVVDLLIEGMTAERNGAGNSNSSDGSTCMSDEHSVAYGLLLENPSLWANTTTFATRATN